MTYRKLKNGTLYGQKGRYRAWIRKKDHGCYSALLSYGGEPIHGEGFLGTSLPRIADAKQFIKIKMSKDESSKI